MQELEIIVSPEKRDGIVIIADTVTIYASVRSVVKTDDSQQWNLNIEMHDLDRIASDSLGEEVRVAYLESTSNGYLSLYICSESYNYDDNNLKIDVQWHDLVLTNIQVRHSGFPSPVDRPHAG